MILRLNGPETGGFTQPASGTYSFTIGKGTGSMAHDFGFGTVDVVLSGKAFTLEFHGRPNVF